MKTLGKEIPIVLRWDFFVTLHYDLSFRWKAYRANGGVSTTMVARVKLLTIGPNSLNLSRILACIKLHMTLEFPNFLL